MRPKTRQKIGLLTRAILDHLAETNPLLIDAFFPKHYPGTGLIRNLFGLDHVRYASRAEARHSISSILNRLKREGLVQCTGPKRKTFWKITKKGANLLTTTPLQVVGPKPAKITPEEDGIVRLVTFDIPEKQRKQRAWLRTELLASGFRPLQKSVFIGKRPLPTSFIKAFDERQLSRYIHIVALHKTGTITDSS